MIFDDIHPGMRVGIAIAGMVLVVTVALGILALTVSPEAVIGAIPGPPTTLLWAIVVGLTMATVAFAIGAAVELRTIATERGWV